MPEQSNNSDLTAYLFTGWGGDERLFANIHLDVKKAIYVKYPTPNQSETIEQYCSRFASLITFQKPFIFVGISLGGMIATELAKHFFPDKLILISSIKTRYEIPPNFHGLDFFQPSGFFQLQFPGFRGLLGKISNEQWNLMLDMYSKSDKQLLMWASMRIPTWKNTDVFENTLHIHGEDDLLLPIKYIRDAKVIHGAGHLAVLTHSDEVNRLIKEG